MRKIRYSNYIIEVKCRNCRKRTRIKIPLRTSPENVPCPTCGMKELHHPSYYGE